MNNFDNFVKSVIEKAIADKASCSDLINAQDPYFVIQRVDSASRFQVFVPSLLSIEYAGAEHTLITYKPKNTCALNLSFQPAVFNLLR